VARLIFAPSAISDIQDILAMLAEKAGYAVAVTYFDRFRSTFDRLAAFPSSGASRPGLGATVRIAVVRPYIVVYRRLPI
jgi:toxin ParE1/3/4